VVIKKYKEDIYFIGAVVLCFTVLSLLFYNSPLPLLILLPFIPYIRKMNRERKKRKEILELTVSFRDFLYSLSISFASGRLMAEGIYEAHEYLKTIYEPSSLIMKEVAQMIIKLKEAKENEENILLDFSEKYPVQDIKIFTETFIAAKKTGGDMEKVVMSSIRILLEKMDILEEIKVMVAQKRMEGKIMTTMPLALLFFLRFTSSDFISILYETMEGRIIMTASLVLILLSYLLTKRITDIRI
jgi:tight adherence protein B